MDGILVTGNDFTLIDQHYISSLGTLFLVKDLGELSYFLGIHVVRNTHSMNLSQSKYFKALLQCVDM